MKVLIVDKLSSSTVTELEKLNLQVEVRSDLTADTLPGAVADVGVLVVRSTKVSAATIQAASQLKLIIRAGGGRRHHRPGRRHREGRLRGQLSRQEHLGSGRTGHRSDDCRRPTDRRRRHGSAQRLLAEEGVRQVSRPGRPHVGHPRLRRHRTRGVPPGQGPGNVDHHLVAAGPHGPNRPRNWASATSTRPRKLPPGPTP